MSPTIIVNIYWLTFEEGGRSKPPSGNFDYCAQMSLDCLIHYSIRLKFEGSPYKAKASYKFLEECLPSKFNIYEGSRLVAKCERE